MLKKKTKNQKGFTLIETIIYIAIIGTVIAVFVDFSLSVSSSRNKVYSAQEVHANAREILSLITTKVHEADNINIGASTFGADPGVLSLAMTDPAKNPTIIFLNQDDGQLQITEGLDPVINISSDEVKVKNLVFSNLSPSTKRENVKIDLTIEYNGSEDVDFNYSRSFQTSASIRK